MEAVSLVFGVTIIVAAVISVRILEGSGAISRAFRSARLYAPWVALLAIAVLGNWAFNRYKIGTSPVFFDQAGPWSESFLQGLQGTLPADLAVPLFSFVYLWIFPALLIALPLALLSERDGLSVRAFCMAMTFSIIGLFACHLAVQSYRPGLTSGSGVSALMYNDPFWGNISLDLGSRGNSFPSGHTAMVTAMLMALIDRPRVRLVLFAILVLVVVAVLYLGLHWPLDVVFGLGLGMVAGLGGRAITKRALIGSHEKAAGPDHAVR